MNPVEVDFSLVRGKQLIFTALFIFVKELLVGEGDRFNFLDSENRVRMARELVQAANDSKLAQLLDGMIASGLHLSSDKSGPSSR